MKIFDRSFDTPEQNLACDEALLEICEEANTGEILRFWEPRDYFIVLGFSNAWKDEVQKKPRSLPVLRRVSGGGTVIQGPGCLNYSLLLKIDSDASRTALKGIVSANQYIMERNRQAVESVIQKSVQIQGSTDLTVNNLKFSGNSQRRKKNYLLFHGTFLLNFKIQKIESFLKMPAKRPVYRENRTHLSFLANLNVPREKIKQAMIQVWGAGQPLKAKEAPLAEIKKLAKEKYSNEEWNFKY